MLKMHVKPETSVVRPYVVCSALRGMTFDEARYNSFIDLQDKLHQNICRRRTLVAIGTHDLDMIEGPFTYEALPPSEIEFKPLKQVEVFKADKLMEFYKSDMKLKKYLHIIEDSPVFPVIYDRNRTVLSLPPIINGAHSAISLKTKNVCTATDLTKAKIITMFSVYFERKFEVEPVVVTYSDGKSYIYPELSPYDMKVSLSFINRIVGVTLEANKIFEVGDVTVLDELKDVGATNHRQLAALYCGATSGFELIHGLVDRIMEVTGARSVSAGDNTGYYIELSDAIKKRCFGKEEPEFLSGRQASIIYKGKPIGTFGIVHP
ncbi:hypothetical protein M8C21_027030, partial [Ambrosia artemisiifolia]